MAGETRLRVFAAALEHETNSFSPLPTILRSFREGVLHAGADAATLIQAKRLPGYGDVLRLAESRGDVLIAGPCAWAQPGGPCSAKDYAVLREVILSELAEALPVDFVFLSLHGAMIAENEDDCEGDILEKVRALVGAHVPIGAVLDLHGNVTARMIESRAVLVAVKEYPHTDYAERTAELYDVLTAAAAAQVSPITLMRRVPMLALLGTTEVPMRDFVLRLKQSEQERGILSVSAMHGFPWSDTKDTSASILVVYDGAKMAVRAHQLADLLAQELFALREAAPAVRLPIDAALDRTEFKKLNGIRPVVLADGADNPGGGAACDSTFILRALLARQTTNVALGMIWDPQAVQIASDAGVGARLSLRIGGKIGPLSGEPVDLEVEVIGCREDAAQRGIDGTSLDPLGPAVAIRARGIEIVLNSTRQQVFSPDCFTQLGIDLSEKDLIVVKSTQHFRAAFDRISAATIYCDAPGSLNTDLTTLCYQRLQRPIWPLDRIESI